MKYIRYILVLFVGITYLLVSSGIIIYQSACSCSGTENVSVYISPETCTVKIHEHHTHNSDGTEESASTNECHECTSHSTDCGCDSPEIKFYKLVEELLPEKLLVLSREKFQPAEAFVYASINILDKVEDERTEQFYIDPPQVIISSHDFLIQIQQLKIHCMC